MNKLVDKIVLITGANKGMGYQTALALASRNWKVIMADKDDQTESRQKIVEETCNEKVVAKHLDLTSFKSVRSFAEDMSNEVQRLDVLINNAGVFCMKNKKTCDSLDGVMQVNHFAPFLLTNLLVELLAKSEGGRIIFVTSSGVFFHNLTVKTMLEPTRCYPGILATALNYYNSKLCTMIASKDFAEDLKSCNITSNCLHPGMTNTTFLVNVSEEDGYFERVMKGITKNALKYTTNDVRKSVGLAVWLATSKSVKSVSGKYFVNYQIHRQPRVLEDEEFCDKILEESERVTGIANDEKLYISS